ncbi:transporter [Corynebacterium diphtheriae]|nr:putative membrane protein [Corynebacterium diphtheriae INCA 402]AEX48312.1 putative membrane protein [Corynebacterium diphtheriae BH8]AEX78474.1 putative membrane protein [Corynebacterium diphtheriae HC03]CAB0497996.1 transporter [Corynebacterium diphtheriae]CAB0542307.1 transporter [Corynebacterium diphtheriae]
MATLAFITNMFSISGTIDIVDIFVANPLLALFVIMAVGLAIGQVKIRGFSLGVAAVLFAGVGFAAVEPDIHIPHLVYILGLSIFVYSIGLESGHAFFALFKSQGVKQNALAITTLALITGISIALFSLIHLNGVTAAGLFTGAVTNTPAMAAVVDSLPSIFGDANKVHEVESLPLVAYSLAYPIGVLGVIAAIGLCAKWFRIDHVQEAHDAGVAVEDLFTRQIKVNHVVTGSDLVIDIHHTLGLEIIVSRIERDGQQTLPTASSRIHMGDVLSVVGTAEELDKAAHVLGDLLPGDPFHGHDLDYRRIFVSNQDLVGIPLAKLRPRLSGILITRVRRGDHDHVATPETVLQLGDRVRVVAAHDRMKSVTALFGDSYRRLSDFNLFPLVAGLALGLLVGMIEVPLPGGAALSLGSAGGPLVVALVLGAVGRSGRFVWQVPYGANLALRQLGITLFLAAIGTTAGASFRASLSDPASLTIIAVGAIITLTLAIFVLVVGYKVMKIPYGQTAGMLAGIQTHPAVLSYVSAMTKNDLPALGYTSVYPLAMIAKIIAAQVVLFALT